MRTEKACPVGRRLFRRGPAVAAVPQGAPGPFPAASAGGREPPSAVSGVGRRWPWPLGFRGANRHPQLVAGVGSGRRERRPCSGSAPVLGRPLAARGPVRRGSRCRSPAAAAVLPLARPASAPRRLALSPVVRFAFGVPVWRPARLPLPAAGAPSMRLVVAAGSLGWSARGVRSAAPPRGGAAALAAASAFLVSAPRGFFWGFARLRPRCPRPAACGVCSLASAALARVVGPAAVSGGCGRPRLAP